MIQVKVLDTLCDQKKAMHFMLILVNVLKELQSISWQSQFRYIVYFFSCIPRIYSGVLLHFVGGYNLSISVASVKYVSII